MFMAFILFFRIFSLNGTYSLYSYLVGLCPTFFLFKFRSFTLFFWSSVLPFFVSFVDHVTQMQC